MSNIVDFVSLRSRRKKKVKKPGAAAAAVLSQASVSDADVPGSSSSRRRFKSTGRPLPKRPSGQTNDAFVPDT